MTDNVVKAQDLNPGDIVEMSPIGQVEVTEARRGIAGGVRYVQVQGVDAQGRPVDLKYAPDSTFRLAYDRGDES